MATMRTVADEVVVAVAPGKGEEYSRVLGDDVEIVEDRQEGIGPLEGLTGALRVAKGDYVIVSPCDTPLIKSEVCRTLFEHGRGRDGAVPCIRGYLEPLHASYQRERCLHAFEATKEQGKRRPKDAYPLLDLATVEEEEIRVLDPDLEHFTNINTRRDHRRVVARLSQE